MATRKTQSEKSETCSFEGASSLRRNEAYQRRRRCALSFLQIVLLSSSMSRSNCFVPSGASRHHPRQSHLLHAELESLTVKELKQLVKDASSERGLLSRLKRKQDLIDYLEQQHPSNSNTERKLSPRNPLVMPRLDSFEKNDQLDRNGFSIGSSLREAAFEKVYERFPALRDLLLSNNYTAPSEDIRQLHHPIFSNINASSDMDVVFVGTASCTPGVTRGVSCTALRLNWRRKSSVWNQEHGRLEAAYNFQGGTWLFDVGECTQVCLLI